MEANVMHGLLADGPEQFQDSAEYGPYSYAGEPFTMTGRGLQLTLGLDTDRSYHVYSARLLCSHPAHNNGFITLYLIRLTSGERDYARIRCNNIRFADAEPAIETKSIFVPQVPSEFSPQQHDENVVIFRRRVQTKLWSVSINHNRYRILNVYRPPFGPNVLVGAPRTDQNQDQEQGKANSTLIVARAATGLFAMVACEKLSCRYKEQVIDLLAIDNKGVIRASAQISSTGTSALVLAGNFSGQAVPATESVGRHFVAITAHQELRLGEMVYYLHIEFSKPREEEKVNATDRDTRRFSDFKLRRDGDRYGID